MASQWRRWFFSQSVGRKLQNNLIHVSIFRISILVVLLTWVMVTILYLICDIHGFGIFLSLVPKLYPWYRNNEAFFWCSEGKNNASFPIFSNFFSRKEPIERWHRDRGGPLCPYLLRVTSLISVEKWSLTFFVFAMKLFVVLTKIDLSHKNFHSNLYMLL